jgi:hypothetical protein
MFDWRSPALVLAPAITALLFWYLNSGSAEALLASCSVGPYAYPTKLYAIVFNDLRTPPLWAAFVTCAFYTIVTALAATLVVAAGALMCEVLEVEELELLQDMSSRGF